MHIRRALAYGCEPALENRHANFRHAASRADHARQFCDTV